MNYVNLTLTLPLTINQKAFSGGAYGRFPIQAPRILLVDMLILFGGLVLVSVLNAPAVSTHLLNSLTSFCIQLALFSQCTYC